MITVLSIIGTIFAFMVIPVGTILGLIGFWMFGFWGALVGVFVGIGIQAGN